MASEAKRKKAPPPGASRSSGSRWSRAANSRSMGFLFAPSRSSNRSIDRKGHDARQPACGSSSPATFTCQRLKLKSTRDSIAMTRDQTRPLQSSLKKPIGLGISEPLNARPSTLDPSCRCNRPDLDQIIIGSGMLGDVPSPHPHIHPAFARQIWSSPLLSASFRLAHWLVAPWLHPQHIAMMRWDSTKGPLKSVEGRPELVGLITASV